MNRLKPLALLAALSMGAALAAPTPVGSFIENQASATYTDPDDASATIGANSNKVYTTTAPLAGVSLVHTSGGADEDDPTSVGASHSFSKTPGEQVVVPYTLTNTGNVDDSFVLSTFVDKPSSTDALETVAVKYYLDVDGDGIYTPGTDTEITAPVALAKAGTVVAGKPTDQAKILMVYTVPSSATVGSTLVIEPVATGQKTSETVAVKQPDGSTQNQSLPVVAVTDGKRTDGTNAQTDPSKKADVQPDGTVEPAGTNVPDNFHKIVIVAGANVSVSKTVVGYFTDAGASTAISGTRPVVGNYIKYQVVASNSGNNDANSVVFSDTLQDGTSYVANSAAVSSSPSGASLGTVSYDGTTRALSVPLSSSSVVKAKSGSTNGTVTLTFVVKIDALKDVSPADGASDPIGNTATVGYKDSVTGQPPTTPPSGSLSTPTQVASVVEGPKGKPNGDGTSGDNYTQAQPGPGGSGSGPTYTVKPSGDQEQIDRVQLTSGGTSPGNDTVVYFQNTVKNTGTATDQFKLGATTTGSELSGVTVKFYPPLSSDPTKPDLSKEITSSGNTGDVAPGATFTYFTVVTIPAGTAPGTNATTPDVKVNITATSVASGSASDPTVDLIDQTARGMTAGNDTSANGTANSGYDNDGVVDSQTPKNQNAKPGDKVTFPMDVVNNGLTPINVVPTGTVDFPKQGGGTVTASVVYYDKCLDANKDGVLTATEIANPPQGCSNTPYSASNPLVVQPGQETDVLAYIDVPSNAVSGTPIVNQTFQDTTNNITLSTGSSTLPKNTITLTTNLYTFSTDGSSTITTSGSTVYTHTLKNDAGSSNPISSFKLTPSGTGDPGEVGDQSKFDVYYSTDGGATYTLLPAGGATLTPSSPLAPGSSLDVKIKVVNKGGSTVGDTHVVVLTLDPTYSGGDDPANQSRTDTTKVQITSQAGTVDLNGDGVIDAKDNPLNYAFVPVKSRDLQTAKPGDTITYTVTGTNNRIVAATLSGAFFCDKLPTNTSFVSVSGTSPSAATFKWFTGNAAATAYTQLTGTPAPTTLNDGQYVCMGVDSLATGGVLTMQFKVKVK